MLRKPKWWDKPVTWGDSVKAGLIGGGIGLMIDLAIFWIPKLIEEHDQKVIEIREQEEMGFIQ